MEKSFTRRINSCGCISLPNHVRNELNIDKDDEMLITVKGDKIILSKNNTDDPVFWHNRCAKFLFDCHTRTDSFFRDSTYSYFYQNGVTTCVVKYNRKKFVGTATLNDAEDVYDPSIGNAIALCRACYGKNCDYRKIIGLKG